MAVAEGRYFLALDGLRGLSILLVIGGHNFFPGWRINGAGYGVQLFFVLSGFLITNILVECREKLAAGSGLGEIIKNFYVRRILRIFPIYIATVALLAAFDFSEFRRLFVWLLLYLTNFYMWYFNTWIGAASHFWSLAVEEQFYLVWPLIILTVPRQLLIPICIFVTAISWPSIYYSFDPTTPFYAILPTSAGAFLSMGALAALLFHRLGLEGAERAFRPGALLGAMVLATIIFPSVRSWLRVELPSPILTVAFSLSCIAMLMAWFLLLVASSNCILSTIFELPPLRYIGSISYGLYVYHFPLLEMMKSYMPDRLLIAGFIGAILSFVLAAASFKYVETPIRNYKYKFPLLTP